MGLTGPNDEPIVCGGIDSGYFDGTRCYTYKDNKWINTSTMTEHRQAFAGSKAPDNGLFVAGGKLWRRIFCKTLRSSNSWNAKSLSLQTYRIESGNLIYLMDYSSKR